MPRPKRPWFRFYVEALSDRKLRRLPPGQRWLWVAVLGCARMSPVPGTLLVGDSAADLDDLADLAGMPARDVAKGVAAFVKAGMLEVDTAGAWVVPKWADRQYESDTSTPRTAKHRSKERSNAVPGNGTRDRDRYPLTSTHGYGSREHPTERTARAAAKQRERHDATRRGDTCGTCNGLGLTLDDNGQAAPCPEGCTP